MISVIMPSHNSDITLDRAVRSVLNQTYKDLELIIVDNGSVKLPKLSDDILMDSRVKMLVYAEVLGAAKARNIGVREASGEYVAFLDSDDYWTPDKLDKQIKVMEKFANQGESPRLVFTGRSIIDANGLETGRYIGCNKIEDGMGLSGMRKRTRGVNGTIEFESEVGFRINMLLPINR